MDRPLKVGAVMYDPKVSVIWEIIRHFFESQACPIDVAFYSVRRVIWAQPVRLEPRVTSALTSEVDG